MKTIPTASCLAAVMIAVLGIAQPAHGQQSVPLQPRGTLPSAVIPSTEAITWSQKHLAGWPEETRRLGSQLVTRYGTPSEFTATRVTWFDKAPWKRITLYKDGPRHNFAAPHKAVLEQVILYKVPIAKLPELAQFHRGLVVDLARGELTSISDSEETNFLALNVADDIVKGERTPEQARTYYAQMVRAKMIKEPEANLQRLKFTPAKSSAETADADEVAPLIRHMSGEDSAGGD